MEPKRSKYRLLGLVGQGQFGRVFCAVHRQTGRLVALKELSRDRFPTHKFLRELRFLLSLRHPNIVSCQALEHTSTGRYLVMDYCEGGTLRNLTQDETMRLHPSQSLKLVIDILQGLEHAHSRGIVHCDIKPENILLSVESEGWTARISDFGIARLSQEITGKEFGNTGSPAYMAPERFYGQYSPSSDLYSVGVLLYELLAGYRPFSGTPAALMSAHLNHPVQIPETIPEHWHSILYTALQKLSARRFQSARDMILALQPLNAIAPPPDQPFPLLQANSTIDFPMRLRSQWHSALDQPIDTLVIQPPLPPASQPVVLSEQDWFLYQNKADGIEIRHYQTPNLLNLVENLPLPSMGKTTVALPAPVVALLPRPQGCFVVTSQAIQLIRHPAPSKLETAMATGSPASKPFPLAFLETIVPFKSQDPANAIQVALDPQGQWGALFRSTSSDPASGGRLTWLRLRQSGPTPTVSTLFSLALTPTWQLQQVLILDRHHLALFLQVSSPSRGATSLDSRTFIKVFSRRGKVLGTLTLPIPVEQVTPTPTPYRFLAIDRQNPQTLVVLDLKPYRLIRWAIDLQPTRILPTAWGYILMNQTTLACLDQDGQSIGTFTTEAPITTACLLEPHGLLLATWNGTQGKLQAIDLRKTGLDLVF